MRRAQLVLFTPEQLPLEPSAEGTLPDPCQPECSVRLTLSRHVSCPDCGTTYNLVALDYPLDKDADVTETHDTMREGGTETETANGGDEHVDDNYLAAVVEDYEQRMEGTHAHQHPTANVRRSANRRLRARTHRRKGKQNARPW